VARDPPETDGLRLRRNSMGLPTIGIKTTPNDRTAEAIGRFIALAIEFSRAAPRRLAEPLCTAGPFEWAGSLVHAGWSHPTGAAALLTPTSTRAAVADLGIK
jgi:hypothetical protein